MQTKAEVVGVLAGNYSEFWQYVEERLTGNMHYVNRTSGKVICKAGKHHFYISGPTTMRGVEFSELVRYGNWYKRDDVDRIEAIYNNQVASRKCKV